MAGSHVSACFVECILSIRWRVSGHQHLLQQHGGEAADTGGQCMQSLHMCCACCGVLVTIPGISRNFNSMAAKLLRVLISRHDAGYLLGIGSV
jgi:hypothetical protein